MTNELCLIVNRVLPNTLHSSMVARFAIDVRLGRSARNRCCFRGSFVDRDVVQGSLKCTFFFFFLYLLVDWLAHWGVALVEAVVVVGRLVLQRAGPVELLASLVQPFVRG